MPDFTKAIKDLQAKRDRQQAALNATNDMIAAMHECTLRQPLTSEKSNAPKRT